MGERNNLYGDRIKKARLSAGLTQNELANILGIPFQSVSQWERGTRTPKIETLEKIASALNCSTDYLLGRTISLVDTTIESVLLGATTVSPLPQKGKFGSSGLQEYLAVSKFLSEMGYEGYIIESDEDEFERVGDGDQIIRKEKYSGMYDVRNGKKYKLLTSEYSNIMEQIRSYTKFVVNEFLKTKTAE